MNDADKYYVYRPLLDLIGFTEGTDKGRGYNETLAYGKMLDGKVTKGRGPTVELVEMTLKELDALQTKMLADPDNKKLNSSAAGRYQIVRTTARSVRKALPERYPSTRKFDADCQDEMACYLLGVRGIDKYLAGRLAEDSLINNLAQEWASLPTTAGGGHYEGQRTPITVARMRQVLAEVRRRHAAGQPKEVKLVEVEKPTVPTSIPKEVDQKTNWFTTALGGVFGAGGVFSYFAGMDRDTLLVWAGIGAVATVSVLIGGKWMVRRLKGIAKEFNE